MALTLIIGGARSGKSALAEQLAVTSGRDVLFIATMVAGDDETAARIAAHRAVRPSTWCTIEEPLDVAGVLGAADDREYLVLDCLTLWISNQLLARLPEKHSFAAAQAALDDVSHKVDGLVAAMRGFAGELVVVSNEVGMGVVPEYPLGRVFRDALGSANAVVAREAGRVYAMTAGLALELKSLGAMPVSAFRSEDA